MSLKAVSFIKSGALVLSAVLVTGQASAETRPDVLERIKPVGTVVVGGEAAAPAGAAAAPAKPMSEGESLYQAKGCAACHGPDGNKTTLPVYPKIGGLPVQYSVNQMKDIKSGKRANGQSAVMKGIVAGVSEEEMTKIAEWLAGDGAKPKAAAKPKEAKAPAAKPAPAPVAKAEPKPAPAAKPEPKSAPAPAAAPASGGGDGAALYASKGCPACHGPSGNKALLPAYPNVAGLPVQYSYNQMIDIKTGKRANGQSAAMKGIVMGIDDKDLKTIAEWLATKK